MTTHPQVHQQEGQVVQHVDLAELFVELDTVEQYRFGVFDQDIAEVKIAMAMAHMAIVEALQNRGLNLRIMRLDGGVIGIDGIFAQFLAEDVDIALVGVDDVLDIGGMLRVAADFRAGMETSDHLAQVVHQFQVRRPFRTGGALLTQDPGRIEAAHDQHAFTGNILDPQIDVGGHALVIAQFAQQRRAPLFGRGEIQETVIDAFLDLVGLGALEHDRGARGLDDLIGAFLEMVQNLAERHVKLLG